MIYDWITGQTTWEPDMPVLLTSADGVAWQQEDVAGLPLFTDLGYGQGTFVAMAYHGVFQSDDLLPRFAPAVRLIGEGFQGEVISKVGGRFRLQTSTNFTAWADLLQVTNAATRIPFIDYTATNGGPRRYYRLAD
jgi:hypothetical protein